MAFFFTVILMDFEQEKLLILVTAKNSSLVCEWKSTEHVLPQTEFSLWNHKQQYK